MTPETATFGMFTIARLAAVAVIATEALILATRRPGEPEGSVRGRLVWSVTPALLLAGLCLWCTMSVAARTAPHPVAGTVAQR